MTAGHIAMLHQYRHAIGGYLWEIPAGCRNAGETPLQCAHRELAEEAGLSARRWDHLGTIVTIPSFCDERIDLYLARDLDVATGTLDVDEVIRVREGLLRGCDADDSQWRDRGCEDDRGAVSCARLLES